LSERDWFYKNQDAGIMLGYAQEVGSEGMNDKAETGSIILDNQSVKVKVQMPSGRIQVTDDVAALTWTMKTGNACGYLWFEEQGKEKKYSLGHKGKRGVLFKTNYYTVRSDRVEDYHDVSLSGPLGDDPDTTVHIQYLLSTTYPVLDCRLWVTGAKQAALRRIEFPLGFNLPFTRNNHIYLPLELKLLKSPEHYSGQLPLWDPVEKENHQVAGSPFFILSQKKSEEQSIGAIGFLPHPLCQMQIRFTSLGRALTPVAPMPDEIGCTEQTPYRIRYQFFPSDDLQAIYWLCYEYLFTEHT
jgi:hypothetical protein